MSRADEPISFNTVEKPFGELVISQIVAGFREAGFEEFRKNNVRLPLGEGFFVWVGIGKDVKDGEVEIFPNFGLHVEPVDKFWMPLRGIKYNRGVATYPEHISNFAQREPRIIFRNTEPIRPVVERTINLYLKHAVPWCQANSSYGKLLPLIEGKLTMLGGFPERYSTILYLTHRIEAARNFVVEFTKKEPQYFSYYAERFLAVLNNNES